MDIIQLKYVWSALLKYVGFNRRITCYELRQSPVFNLHAVNEGSDGL